jgi:hypothetical protein
MMTLHIAQHTRNMTRVLTMVISVTLMPWLMTSSARADQRHSDKGKEVVGNIKATLYIGMDSVPDEWAMKYPAPAGDVAAELRSIKQMKFRHYRKLGTDTQPVFRSYENWLAPIKPSEEILLSYESRGRAADGGLRLDLEFWQQRRKIMQMNAVLYVGKQLLILGPGWRGGRMIVAVELAGQ